MDRYGASSRHYDHDCDVDSASDTGRNYSPRSGGPPRRSFRGHPAPRGPTRGHGAHADPYTSGYEGDDSDFDLGESHHHHDGHAGGAHGADLLGSDNELSEIEASGYRHRHVYGRGRAGGMNRNGPSIWGRADGAGHVGSTHFCSDHSNDDDDDDDSDGEWLAAARGGRRAEMRFDTDSSDEGGIHQGHYISHGAGGRRSTAAPYLSRRGRAQVESSSSDESEFDGHVAARQGRGAMRAGPRGGMMAPAPSRAAGHGRAQGDRRGAVRGGRP